MKRRNFLLSCLLFTASCTASATNPNSKTVKSGRPFPEKLRFTATDSQGMQELQEDYEQFRLALEEVLSVKVEFVPLQNYSEIASAIQLDRIDLALIGPSEHIFLQARTNAVPVVAITRPNYHSLFAVPATSGIKSLTDLKGKTIAMMEAGATAGYIGPLKMLVDAGIDPKQDLKIVYLGNEGLQALKAGKVDAWAGSNNRYEREIQAEKAEKAFPILAAGPTLPSDVFVASSLISSDFVEEMRSRLLQQQEKLIQALLAAPANKKYQQSQFRPFNDAEYNMIREVYKAVGQGDFIQ